MSRKIIPYDTRQRIVGAYKRGNKAGEIAEMFGVSKREVYRLVKQEKETGDVQLHTHDRGRKPNLTDEQLDQVRRSLDEQPDITLQDLIDKLELPISVSRLCRIIRKFGFRLKKKVIHASEQERPRRSGQARKLDSIQQDAV